MSRQKKTDFHPRLILDGKAPNHTESQGFEQSEALMGQIPLEFLFMIYAENQTHRKLVRWLDRHMAELRPAQVEALAWNVLRIRDVGGAVDRVVDVVPHAGRM